MDSSSGLGSVALIDYLQILNEVSEAGLLLFGGSISTAILLLELIERVLLDLEVAREELGISGDQTGGEDKSLGHF